MSFRECKGHVVFLFPLPRGVLQAQFGNAMGLSGVLGALAGAVWRIPKSPCEQ